MKDRRKTNRRYLLYYARIFDAVTRQQIGNLVDITPLGAMVLSPEPFQVGQKYFLRIELTDDVSKHPHMDIHVLARWSHLDIDPHLYNTGFEIQDLGSEEEETIHRIIGIYGFRDNTIKKP